MDGYIEWCRARSGERLYAAGALWTTCARSYPVCGHLLIDCVVVSGVQYGTGTWYVYTATVNLCTSVTALHVEISAM